MEHSRRSRPQMGNLCPVCSNSHFPFCLPPPQNFRLPPPPSQYSEQFFNRHLPPIPPPHPPSYDPLVDHQGPPAANPYAPPPQLLPRPWSNNSNVGEGFYENMKPRLDYDDAQTIGAKRMRVDYSGHSSGPCHYLNGSCMIPPGDDKRRLKLIRYHGAMNHDLNRSNDLGKKISAYTFEKMSNFSHLFQGKESENFKEINIYEKRNYDTQLEYSQEEIVELGQLQYNRIENNFMQNQVCENKGDRADGYKNLDQAHGVHQTHIYNTLPTPHEIIKFPSESQPEFSKCISQSGATLHQAMEPKYYSLSGSSDHIGQLKRSQGYNGQPPLPTSPPPPPPLPLELTGLNSLNPGTTSSASSGSSLFPVPAESAPSLPAPYPVVSEGVSSEANEYSRKGNPNSGGYYTEEIQAFQMTPSKMYLRESEDIPSLHLFSEKPMALDVSHILKKPHRNSRPDHIVIILRGLPGSGKSYLAKILRDLEVENGGSAPRIHSMDDYFMIEVEKVEDSEGSKSKSSVRGKKPTKKVMEYCYEPEMEEAYRSSMLKAFKKTLDEGVFFFVIVDDRNLRVADFDQFWATAKRSGYEVYLLEAAYKDPVGCAARNIHGFAQNDIQKMARQWEDAPPLYMKLDVTSLLHGDDLEENGIREVDMDTEDGDHIRGLPGSECASAENSKLSKEQCPIEVVTEFGNSKWSNDLDEDDVQKAEVTRVKLSAFSGLAKSYSNQGKSVCWADQVGSIGFSIGVAKTANVSLVIGRGSGYNLKSNPLPEEEKLTQRTVGSKRQKMLQDQLRAEREAFRAVFDKRRQIIGGVDMDEE
ncbi:uncharacterized protein LOC142556152 isoform X2 [Primulina tabacum]|uniref:uncharacterized protein LOC142556152 isoform X2 n=1 Tax=Primulina tabacum TaxID=48773 RepID=UPI003F59E975